MIMLWNYMSYKKFEVSRDYLQYDVCDLKKTSSAQIHLQPGDNLKLY